MHYCQSCSARYFSPGNWTKLHETKQAGGKLLEGNSQVLRFALLLVNACTFISYICTCTCNVFHSDGPTPEGCLLCTQFLSTINKPNCICPVIKHGEALKRFVLNATHVVHALFIFHTAVGIFFGQLELAKETSPKELKKNNSTMSRRLSLLKKLQILRA